MLLDLSEALGSPLDLRASFARALEILETDLKAVFGVVAFFEPESGELKVEAVTSRHDAAARKARYRLGEGISTRVVKTGKPIVVPHAGQEPLFRDQLGLLASRKSPRDDLSYTSVPIRIGGRSAGALAVAFV